MAYSKRIAGITIKLEGDTSALVKSLDQVSRKVTSVGDSIARVGSSLTRNLTVPIVTAAGVAVSKFAEVDKTMTLTNATMANTEEEANLLNTAMENAASNSVFGMSEAATATLNFARAGLDAKDAADALAPAMNLAAGEGGDLDVVSAGLIATIKGFGDSCDQSAHYADVFANACNNSALDIDSLSDAMSVAAPVFDAAGYSVEDAALYMGVMANKGIDASEAANSLKTGLARLISPAKQGASAMLDIGLASLDAEGNIQYAFENADGTMKSSIEVQQLLHDSFSNLSETEQIAAASAIFGKNQMSKWLALINTAPSSVNALSSDLEKEGTTAEMADAMMSGFGGSIEKLKSSLDVLMTSLGRLAAEYLSPVIEKVQGVVDKFLALDDETKQHIIKVLGIIATVGPIILIVGKIISGIGTLISVVSTLATVVGAASLPVLGIAAAIGVVIFAIYEIVKHWDEIKEFAGKVKDAVVEKWNGIKEAVANSKLAEAVSNVWDNVKKTVGQSLAAIKKSYDDHGGGIKGAIYAGMEGVKQYYTAGLHFIDNMTGGKLTAIKDKVKTNFDNIVNSVKERITKIKDSIKNGIDNAIAFMKNLPQQALQWGKDLIQNLIDGIMDKVRGLIDAVKNIADTIKSYIHFSEPDVGPLSDFNTYMPDMINMMVQGINAGIPKVADAMSGLAAAMVPGTSTTSNTNTITMNVYGAEGQNVAELADIIQDRINNQIYSRGAVFA